jgi:hypothetical protein
MYLSVFDILVPMYRVFGRPVRSIRVYASLYTHGFCGDYSISIETLFSIADSQPILFPESIRHGLGN